MDEFEFRPIFPIETVKMPVLHIDGMIKNLDPTPVRVVKSFIDNKFPVIPSKDLSYTNLNKIKNDILYGGIIK